MKRIISAFAAFAAAIAAAAAAPQASHLSYETTYFPKTDESGDRMEFVSASGIAFDGKFSVWYLLGEPLINCTARWTNSGRESMVIDPLRDGARIIEPARDGEIEIYNLLLAASGPDPRDKKYGFGSAKTIAVLCDAGIVAQNGRGGFNVAESPSWDKFLCALPDAGVRFQGATADNKDHCLAMNGQWLSAAEAKDIARNGLKLDGVTALKAQINGVAIVKRAEKRQWREKSAAFKLNRTAAMLNRMRVRDGESPLDLIERRSQADRRLPKLPTKDPSTEQLAAYEAAWREVVSELADADKAFTDEWRAKEKELVGEQLERLKKLDKAAAKEEQRFFNYRLALNEKKKNEPTAPDPMAAYRTDTPLVMFKDGARCGFKDAAGKTVIPAGFAECFAREGYGLYGVQSDHYYFPPECGDRNCAIVYDQQGRELIKVRDRIGGPKGGQVILSFYPQHGLFGFTVTGYSAQEQITGHVWSLLDNQFIHEIPNFQSDLIRGYFSGVYLRRERLALAYLSGTNCNGGGYFYGIHYFYLDTRRVEESGLCTYPAKDPLNTKPEE